MRPSFVSLSLVSRSAPIGGPFDALADEQVLEIVRLAEDGVLALLCASDRRLRALCDDAHHWNALSVAAGYPLPTPPRRALFNYVRHRSAAYAQRVDDALFAAVLANDVERVRALLFTGANPDHGGLLIVAAECGLFAVVRALLAAGASAFHHNSYALRQAASNGHLAVVNALLAAGANPRAPWVLEDAAMHGRAAVLRALLAATGYETIQLGEALITAARGGHAAAVRALLTGTTALDRALMLTNGKNRALHVAVAAGSLEIVREMLAAGADANSTDHEYAFGHRAMRPVGILVSAAAYGNTEIFELLLAAGASVEQHGGAALVAAVRSGHVGIARALLAAGADARVWNGRSLVESAIRGDAELVDELLAAGAPPDGQRSEALIRAATHDHIGIVRTLIAAGAKPEAQFSRAVYEAAGHASLEVVRTLLDAGGDARARHATGSALYSAARRGSLPIVRALLAAATHDRWTILHGLEAVHDPSTIGKPDHPEILAILNALLPGATNSH
jgi:ankyrin repeat protein